MRYALIIAGGSGTRLWPMSTAARPKQLIPFIDGRSLLQIAVNRLRGLLPETQIYVCAGESHRDAILAGVEGLARDHFIGEPTGRDTLNAVGLGTAVLTRRDPDAGVGVFTADHLIEPVDAFQATVDAGYALAESRDDLLVTFGIAPTHPATGFGYLQLGEAIHHDARAFDVQRFKEKPDRPTAEQYLAAGPDRYLWNSGMFAWRGRTMLQCIQRYARANYAGIMQCADDWGSPLRQQTLEKVYPTLEKISVDYAVLEPASQDDAVQLAALPMAVQWLDVGSWPAFAETRPRDDQGNAIAASHHLALDAANNLLASSDPEHLVAAMGVRDLIIIHTPDATLVCHKDHAERIKQLHARLGETGGERWL
ncbi:MAG: mannose-1-phosphate guanylyltransferase [Phycisphaeraceae bacterium]